MANETVARRYAVAIYGLASERHVVEPVGRDIAAAERAIFSDPLTRGFFVAPVIDRSDKERLLGGVFTDRLDRWRSTRFCFWSANGAAHCCRKSWFNTKNWRSNRRAQSRSR